VQSYCNDGVADFVLVSATALGTASSVFLDTPCTARINKGSFMSVTCSGYIKALPVQPVVVAEVPFCLVSVSQNGWKYIDIPSMTEHD